MKWKRTKSGQMAMKKQQEQQEVVNYENTNNANEGLHQNNQTDSIDSLVNIISPNFVPFNQEKVQQDETKSCPADVNTTSSHIENLNPFPEKASYNTEGQMKTRKNERKKLPQSQQSSQLHDQQHQVVEDEQKSATLHLHDKNLKLVQKQHGCYPQHTSQNANDHNVNIGSGVHVQNDSVITKSVLCSVADQIDVIPEPVASNYNTQPIDLMQSALNISTDSLELSMPETSDTLDQLDATDSSFDQLICKKNSLDQIDQKGNTLEDFSNTVSNLEQIGCAKDEMTESPNLRSIVVDGYFEDQDVGLFDCQQLEHHDLLLPTLVVSDYPSGLTF